MGKKENLPVPEGFFQDIGKDIVLSDSEKKELAKFQDEGMKEEMRGLPVEYPRIKILHVGAAQFQFPDESTAKGFLGVIIHSEASRVWWPWAFGEGPADDDRVPKCFSRDLINPDPSCTQRQSDSCSNCPQNAWGSDPKGGRGKACREVRRLFVLPEGRMTPHWMGITPANLKPLSKYFSVVRDSGVARPQMIVTRFSLLNVKNKENITYSELSLSKGDPLPAGTVYNVIQLKEAIESMLESASPMTEDEYLEKDPPAKDPPKQK
jgi:hypothetical protein